MSRGRLSFNQQRVLFGFLFTLPFTIGFILFFLHPFIKSMIFSLSDLRITADGYQLDYVGLKHYHFILFVDPKYIRTVVETFLRSLRDVPLIIFFSLFAASVLNQRFKGRTLARVIFFLPVILSAGIVLKMEQLDFVTRRLLDSDLAGAGGTSIFSDIAVRLFFQQLNLPTAVIDFLMKVVDDVALLIRASGIQILIFLAGLQSISSSLYEAADVEGATGWERFWKITFPLLTPLVLTNVVFTVIDSFTAGNNKMMNTLYATISSMGYSVSSAMAWFYFVFVAIVLGVTVKFVSRGVFYREQ